MFAIHFVSIFALIFPQFCLFSTTYLCLVSILFRDVLLHDHCVTECWVLLLWGILTFITQHTQVAAHPIDVWDSGLRLHEVRWSATLLPQASNKRSSYSPRKAPASEKDRAFARILCGEHGQEYFNVIHLLLLWSKKSVISKTISEVFW